MSVFGSGVPAGATVLSVDTATSFTLSANATATGANTVVVFAPNGLGSSPNVANALILDGGILQYTGTATSTDRAFTLTQNGGGLDGSGSGPVVFSNTLPVVLSGTGARTF